MTAAPHNEAPTCRQPRQDSRVETLLLVVLVAAFAFLALATLPDYGLTWDAAWENYYGDKNLLFFLGFDREHLDFTKPTVRLYERADHPDFHWITTAYADNDIMIAPILVWPLGPTFSSLCKYIFYGWLDLYAPIDAHHVAAVLAATLMLAVLVRFVCLQIGARAAVVAGLALATHPRLWAHAHNNVKDVLTAALFTLTIVAFCSGVQRRRARLVVGSAALWGLGLAAKPNALFLPFILIPWFLLVFWRDRRATPPTPWPRPVWTALGAYPFVGLVAMFLPWPLLWQEFPHNLGLYIDSLFGRGYGGAAGWDPMPVRNAFATMPVAFLILLLGGLAVIAWRTWRRRIVAPLHLLLLLWMIVPVLRVCVPGARDFDGIRHWLEVLPAMAAIAGIGGAAGLDALSRALGRTRLAPHARTALCLAGAVALFVPVIAWSARNHPNQLAYYNPLVGRLPGARERGYMQATDYWGSSYRQGVDWLNAHVAEQAPLLVVGVAEHIVFYVHQTALDRRIALVSVDTVTPAFLAAAERPVYLMHITREEWYGELTQVADAHLVPVHEIVVDGAAILKIQRLR